MADLIKKARDERAAQIERQKKKGLIDRHCNYGQHLADPEVADFLIGDRWFYVCLYCQGTIYKGKMQPINISAEELITSDVTEKPTLIVNRMDKHQGHKTKLELKEFKD
tara:strand:+ start:2470 stop:2796 length:327 start_codon:yes stop_codon:yes gene_type:complete